MPTKMKSMFIFQYLHLKNMERLSNKNSEQLVAGSRVEVSKYKREPT